MKRVSIAIGLLLIAQAAFAGGRGRVTGDYVEARTAEVFAGGCIMNSEAETMGRQAILAWRIATGSFDGVTLDGLTVVAAVAGDRNLGMREMGGEEPTSVKAIITVDPRATAEQRDALVALVRELSGGLISEVVRVETARVRFATTSNYVEVSVPDSVDLVVNKEMKHDPSCGAMQWFKPFTSMMESAMGTAESHSFSGDRPGNAMERARQALSVLGHVRVLKAKGKRQKAEAERAHGRCARTRVVRERRASSNTLSVDTNSSSTSGALSPYQS